MRSGLMPHPTAPSPPLTTTYRIKRSRKRASTMVKCHSDHTRSSSSCTSRELPTNCPVLLCQAQALMVQQSPHETTLKSWVANSAQDTRLARLASLIMVQAQDLWICLGIKSLRLVSFPRREKTRCCRDLSRQDSHFSERSA